MPTKQDLEMVSLKESTDEENAEKSEIIEDYKKLNDKVCTTLLKIKQRKVKRMKKLA